MDDTTQDEMKAILLDMQTANSRIYQLMFNMGFGSKCHAFLEFCGLMSKYTDLCRIAMQQGKQFNHMNTHSGESLDIAEHNVEYLAEKFDCIFGPFFKANPEAAKLFAERALGLPTKEEE